MKGLSDSPVKYSPGRHDMVAAQAFWFRQLSSPGVRNSGVSTLDEHLDDMPPIAQRCCHGLANRVRCQTTLSASATAAKFTAGFPVLVYRGISGSNPGTRHTNARPKMESGYYLSTHRLGRVSRSGRGLSSIAESKSPADGVSLVYTRDETGSQLGLPGKGKRVVVGMSGGVDSSVAAMLLQRQVSSACVCALWPPFMRCRRS